MNENDETIETMEFWAGQILAAVTDNRPDAHFRLVLVTGDPDATGKLSEIEPTTPDEEGWIKEIDIQMGDDVAANKPIPVDPWGVLYKLAVAIDEDRPGSRRRRCGLPSLPGYGYSGHRSCRICEKPCTPTGLLCVRATVHGPPDRRTKERRTSDPT